MEDQFRFILLYWPDPTRQGVENKFHETLSLLSTGITGMHYCTWYMQCQGSNPGLRACWASTLPTELHSEPAIILYEYSLNWPQWKKHMNQHIDEFHRDRKCGFRTCLEISVASGTLLHVNILSRGQDIHFESGLMLSMLRDRAFFLLLPLLEGRVLSFVTLLFLCCTMHSA